MLVLDETQAVVVQRIFEEYLTGSGDRAIAAGLNRDSIPCPSACRPDQNRHRAGDGWQGSTVRSILENPRYTGYEALTRFQTAIAAGVDPSALVEAINRAQAQRDAARAELAHQPARASVLDEAEVYAIIDSLGDVGAVIEQARPDRLARLYRDLRLEVHYRHAPDGGEATATVRVGNECVRGGTCTLTIRIELAAA